MSAPLFENESPSQHAIWPRSHLVSNGLNLIEWHVGSTSEQFAPGLADSFQKIGARWFSAASELSGMIRETPHLPIGTLIFHVGLCGSTLVTRILNLNPSLRVFNEPYIVRKGRFWRKTSPKFREDYFSAHGLAPHPDEKSVAVKMNSMALVEVSSLASQFPDALKILVFREPYSTLVGLNEGNWDLHSPRARLNFAKRLGEPGESFSNLSRIEALGRILALKYSVATDQIHQFDLVLDYAKFPEQLLVSLERFVERSEIESILSQHSKSGEPFHCDREKKLGQVSQEIRTIVERDCLAAYERLQSVATEL